MKSSPLIELIDALLKEKPKPKQVEVLNELVRRFKSRNSTTEGTK